MTQGERRSPGASSPGTAPARVVGLGAGGHAKVMVEALRAAGGWELVGLLDPDRSLHGTTVAGLVVLGGDEMLDGLRSDGVSHAFVAVGSVRPTLLRRRLFEVLCARGFRPADALHPAAVASPSATWGGGLALLAMGVINADATLGNNVIVNTGGIVEHDCVVGSHVHVAPGARLGGGVRVGDGAHVGMGALVLEGVNIGAGALVAAGAVVREDVSGGAIVAGVPARVVGEEG